MKIGHTIEAVIQLKTPLHISTGQKWALDDNWRPTTKDGRPLTRTQRQPMFAGNPFGEDDAAGRPTWVPVMNANTGRGGLRRAMDDIIFESLIKSRTQISREETHVLLTLAHSGKPSKDTVVDYDRSIKARDHIFAGIWGGGPEVLRSAIVTPWRYPITEETLEVGVVPGHLEDYARGRAWELTFYDDLYRGDDIVDFRDRRFEVVVNNYDSDIRDLQASIMEERAKKKSGGTDKKEGLQNMFAYEFVAPGVHFHLRIELGHYLNNAQVGATLLAFERSLGPNQYFGGLDRYGAGRFIVAQDPLLRTADGNPVDDDLVEGMREDALEQLTSISSKDLQEVYFGVTEDDKPKKKAKKVA